MNDMNKERLADRSAFKMIIRGKPVFVSFSKTESVGLKDKVRDILTESFEERYLKSVKQYSEE